MILYMRSYDIIYEELYYCCHKIVMMSLENLYLWCFNLCNCCCITNKYVVVRYLAFIMSCYIFHVKHCRQSNNCLFNRYLGLLQILLKVDNV